MKHSLMAKHILRLVGVCLVTAVSMAQQRPPLRLSALLNPTESNQKWIRKHPDEFSWMLLVLISKKADRSLQTQIPTGEWTNNVEWETWASDDFTFPETPQPDAPKWEDRLVPNTKILHKDPLRSRLMQSERIGANRPEIFNSADLNGGDEEVRRNRDSFNFITCNRLWYREGILAFSRKEVPMQFSSGSIEIKAFWRRPLERENHHYHWNYTGDGTKYKLVGLHISTKALPEWTWATFESADNPGRCNYNDCKDTFGVRPERTLHREPPNSQPYKAGRLTPAVKRLFKSAGVHAEEWDGYRLTGSQTLVDKTPIPQKLANSANEGSFATTSSCLGCHQRARTSLVDGAADPTAGFNPSREGYLDFASSDDLVERNKREHFYASDFVWAFLKARPLCPNSSTALCSH